MKDEKTLTETNEDERRLLELTANQAGLRNKKGKLFKWIGLATVTFGSAWPIFQYTRTLRQNEPKQRN